MAKYLIQFLLFASLTTTALASGTADRRYFDFGTTYGYEGWTAGTPGGWQETLGTYAPIYVPIPKPPSGPGNFIWLEQRTAPLNPVDSVLTAPPGGIEIFDGTTICGRFYRHVTIDDDLDRVNLTLTGTNGGLPYSRLLLRIDDYDVWKYTEITCGTAQGQEPCCPIYPCFTGITFELAGLNVYSLEAVAVDYIATTLTGACPLYP